MKRNQPRLHAALARLPGAAAPGQIRRDRGHGRVESRPIKVISLDGVFPGTVQTIKVVRRRRQLRGGRPVGKASVETVYALTSLDHRAAHPGLLGGWLQGHWTIENRLHWIHDVTQREDTARIRTGSGPQVMAALRNTARNLDRLSGQTNITRAARHYANQPAACRQLLHTA